MPGEPTVAPWRRPVQSVKGAMAAVAERYRGAPRGARAGMNVVFIALAALLPTILPYVTTNDAYYTQILTKIGIAALLALGLNVVVGFAGLLDLGYVAFFAVGAYAFAVLTGSPTRPGRFLRRPCGTSTSGCSSSWPWASPSCRASSWAPPRFASGATTWPS